METRWNIPIWLELFIDEVMKTAVDGMSIISKNDSEYSCNTCSVTPNNKYLLHV